MASVFLLGKNNRCPPMLRTIFAPRFSCPHGNPQRLFFRRRCPTRPHGARRPPSRIGLCCRESPEAAWAPLHSAMRAAEHANGWFAWSEVKHAAEVWVDALAPKQRSARRIEGQASVAQPQAGHRDGRQHSVCRAARFDLRRVSGHRVKAKPSRDDAHLTATLSKAGPWCIPALANRWKW